MPFNRERVMSAAKHDFARWSQGKKPTGILLSNGDNFLVWFDVTSEWPTGIIVPDDPEAASIEDTKKEGVLISEDGGRTFFVNLKGRRRYIAVPMDGETATAKKGETT
jgi:hypothetical protein